MTQAERVPAELLVRLHHAWNRHDLDTLLACLDPRLDSVEPAHPNRAALGSESLQQRWAEILASVPDLRADLLRAATDGDTIWTEWRWYGTRLDRSWFEVCGVLILGIAEGRITWIREYAEPVQEPDPSDEAAGQ